MSSKVCSHRGCFQPAPHGLGWGLSTGMVQWFCGDHFPTALGRLAGLLAAVREAAAPRREEVQPKAA
jgi:hypothetical protein